MVNENKKFTIKEYATMFSVADKTAKRDMKKLIEQELIIKRGVKKGAFFEVR